MDQPTQELHLRKPGDRRRRIGARPRTRLWAIAGARRLRRFRGGACRDRRPPSRHATGSAPSRAIEIRGDIDAVRRIRPDIGQWWRAAVRAELGARGVTVLGFDRVHGYAIKSKSLTGSESPCD